MVTSPSTSEGRVVLGSEPPLVTVREVAGVVARDRFEVDADPPVPAGQVEASAQIACASVRRPRSRPVPAEGLCTVPQEKTNSTSTGILCRPLGRGVAGRSPPGSGPIIGRVSTTLPAGTVHELPADLRRGSSRCNVTALEAWHDITPLARNEFICWVEDAKQAPTRERRIRRTREELEEGTKFFAKMMDNGILMIPIKIE